MALIVWLTVLWIALWDEPSPANLVSGLLVAVIVTALFPIEQIGERHRVRPLALAAFNGYFVWKLVEANVVLAREILTRRDSTRTGIIAVALQPGSTDLVTTIVANAVSLTPGTLTLEASTDPHVLYVHVLHLHDPDQVRRDIQKLEQLARRAFGLDTNRSPDSQTRPETT
jgi:multicomponent Na+:H+ antiporter subunit E